MKTSTRVRIALAGVLCTLTATSLVGHGDRSAQAQDAPVARELGGYQGRASASGIHLFYTPEGLLPVPSLIDIGAPNSLATIASGPSTFARASTADPGDLLANPDALLTLVSSEYPQGLIPAYPYRASATSGFGAPTQESNPAPGLNARAEVTSTGSVAQATMPKAIAPAIASFGTLSSLATTDVDGSTVTVRARSEMSGFSLLDVLKIESIVTDITVSSTGEETTVTGGTTVAGATLLGLPATIDAEGIHVDREAAPSDPAAGALGDILGGLGGVGDVLSEVLGSVSGVNDVLAAAGIKVTLVGPAETEGDNAGQLSSAGLRIDIDFGKDTVPQLTELLDSIPNVPPLAPGVPTLDDVLAAVQATHVARLEVASASVSLRATPVPAFEPTTPVTVTPPSAGVSPSFALPSTGVAAPSTPAAPPVESTPATTPATPIANLPLGAGIGVLGLLALLVQPFIGSRLAGMATAILADDGISCPSDISREQR